MRFATSIASLGILTGLLMACSPAEPDKIQGTQVHSEYSRLKQLSQAAPFVEPRPTTITYHDISVEDPYQWLRDPSYPNTDDPEVLDYLNAENDYYQAFLSPNKDLVETLFEEFKGRVDETDTSVPFVKNGYEYRWEFQPGNDYRTRIRKNLETGEEAVFLDEQALSEGQDYFVLGGWDISPDNTLVAYSVDTSGDERYTVVVKNIASGEILPVDIQNAGGGVSFTSDNKGLIYPKLSNDRWFTESINVRFLAAQDGQVVEKTLFVEQDEAYFLGFGFSSDEKWLFKYASRGANIEIAAIPANDLDAEPVIMVSREEGVEATIDAAHDKLYLLVNDTHVNSRLVRVDAEQFGQQLAAKSNWETLIEGADSHYLQGFQTFEQFIALQLSIDGLERIHLLDVEGKLVEEVEFPESVYAASIAHNAEFTQAFVRLNYGSMITPNSVFDYQVSDKQLITRKVRQIPSGYDASQYRTERLMAPARDGAMIPVSIVYHKDFVKDGNAPMSLYAYGAYGSGISPRFSAERLSLLDRGFSFAIAHVRGGDEMGYQWYLDGKLEKRMNAFTDFIDVADFLVEQNYTREGNISISGRSAGGKMMGAMTIQAPEMWRSVMLVVPFVDVLNTMLDASLPLTPPEWQEWGNPIEDKAAFEYMLSYSPYDQITARDYPPMMVTGGLNDPRVTYWEPAKWTARMRATKTDDNLLVMRMNMGAGHFANSGRYGRLKDRAEEYAFQLLAHQIKE